MFITPDNVPDKIKNIKWCAGLYGYIILEVVAAVTEYYSKINIMMHSFLNGPDMTMPLLKTSRKDYLAMSLASTYVALSFL